MSKHEKINLSLKTILLILSIFLISYITYLCYQFQQKTINPTTNHLNQRIDGLFDNLIQTKDQSLIKIEAGLNSQVLELQKFIESQLESQIQFLIDFINNKINEYLDDKSKEDIIQLLKEKITNFGKLSFSDFYGFFKKQDK